MRLLVKLVPALWLLCTVFSTVNSVQAQDQPGVYVNRSRLSDAEVLSLLDKGVAVQTGKYWLDCISGLWGFENGPAVGQLPEAMNTRCEEMPADISRSKTYVYINGREIHAQELQFLTALYGSVVPGRYWLNRQGIGGFENQPALFNIPQAAQAYSARTQRGGLGHIWRGGSVIGDSGTVGFISSDEGASVTCGPDGGCIY